MGWAPGDEEKVLKCKLALSKARQALYALKKEVQEIKHPEKGPALLVIIDSIEERQFKEVEIHLNR